MSRFETLNSNGALMLLMHIPTLNQVHVIHTYVSYCFTFKINLYTYIIALGIANTNHANTNMAICVLK